MFDAGITLGLLGLLGAKAEGGTRAKHKRHAAVDQLGEHAKDARDEADKLRARLKRGVAKLAAVVRDLANARAHAGDVSPIDRRLSHDLRTQPAKLADVLEHAAGLARDKHGRWRLVERGPSKPDKPEAHTEPAHTEPAHVERKRKRARISPHAAAVELRAYLATPGANWGWQGTPSPNVELRQRQMRQVKADGIMGKSTRARARALGVMLPAAPLPKNSRSAPSSPSSTRPPTAPAPSGRTEAQKRATRLRRERERLAAARKRRAARRAAARAGAPKPAAPPTRSPEQAARDLHDHLATPGASWGWQGTPSPTIALAQHDMGGDTGTPGVMGLKTRARARELGVTLPAGPR